MKKNDCADSINPIQDGGQPPPPTGFSPVTFRKDRISTLNFLTFSFNFFCHTGVKCQGYTLCKSQIIEFKPNLPLKKVVLWSNPYKTRVISSLMEMLGLPDFVEMTASTIQFKSRDKVLLQT